MPRDLLAETQRKPRDLFALTATMGEVANMTPETKKYLQGITPTPPPRPEIPVESKTPVFGAEQVIPTSPLNIKERTAAIPG